MWKIYYPIQMVYAARPERLISFEQLLPWYNCLCQVCLGLNNDFVPLQSFKWNKIDFYVPYLRVAL